MLESHVRYLRFENSLAMSRAVWLLRQDKSVAVQMDPQQGTEFLRLIGSTDDLKRLSKMLDARDLPHLTYQEDMYRAWQRGSRRRRAKERVRAM